MITRLETPQELRLMMSIWSGELLCREIIRRMRACVRQDVENALLPDIVFVTHLRAPEPL